MQKKLKNEPTSRLLLCPIVIQNSCFSFIDFLEMLCIRAVCKDFQCIVARFINNRNLDACFTTCLTRERHRKCDPKLYHIIAYRARCISNLEEKLELGYATEVDGDTKSWPNRPFTLVVSAGIEVNGIHPDVLSKVKELRCKHISGGLPSLPSCKRFVCHGLFHKFRHIVPAPISLKSLPDLRVLTIEASASSRTVPYNFDDWPRGMALKIFINHAFNARANREILAYSNLRCIHLLIHDTIDFQGTEIHGPVQTVLIQHYQSSHPNRASAYDIIEFLGCLPNTVERLIISTPEPQPIIEFCNKRFTKITTQIIAKVVNLAEFEY